MSSLIVALPFSYSVVVSAKMMEKINHLTTWQYFGLSSYLAGYPRTTVDTKKPAELVPCGLSGFLRTYPEEQVVELAGVEPASEIPTSSVLHA